MSVETGTEVDAASRLAAFLRAHVGEVLEAWERSIDAGFGRARDRRGQRDRLPELLATIADAVEARERTRPRIARLAVRSHVLEQIGRGLELEDVAADYALLRRLVVEQVRRARLPVQDDDLALLHEVFDEVMVRVAETYARARARLVEAIDEVAREAAESDDLERLLARVQQVIARSMDSVDWSGVFLVEGELLRARSLVGVGESFVGTSVRLGEGVVGRCAVERKPLHVTTSADELFGFGSDGGETVAAYAVPLVSGETLVGVGVVASREVCELSDEDRALLRAVFERVASCVAQVQLRAESAAARRLLDAVVSNLPVGVLIAEAPLGRVLLGNHRLEQILRGTAAGAASAVAGARELGPELTGRRFADWPISRTLAEGCTILDEEIELVRADGERRSARCSSTPLMDGDRVVAAVMVVEDVTEKERAAAERERLLQETQRALETEEATLKRLAESEAMVDAFLRNAPSIIFIKDLQGRYTLFNRRFVRGLGLRSEQVLGKTDRDIFPPDVAARMGEAERRVVERGAALMTDEEVVGPYGGRAYMTIRFPIRDAEGRTIALGGIATDMTAAKRRERTLALLSEAGALLVESRDYGETLQAIARIGGERLGDLCRIGILDERYEVLPVAAAARDPEALRKLDRARSHAALLQPGTPWGDALRRGEPLFLKRVRPGWAAGMFPDPAERAAIESLGVCSVVLAPLVSRGRLFGLLSIATTARRLTREEFRAAVELARRSAIAIENARLYRAAQEAVRAREEFMSVAAHELRTPMATVLLQLDRLVRKARARQMDVDACARVVEGAAEQLARLSGLLDLLFDLSRATTGRMELRRETVDLAGIAREVVEEMQPQADLAGCTLAHAGEPSVVGHWDRVRMRQVVTNLVGNAVKHAPGAAVEVDVRVEGERARLTVSDDGPGIPGEKLQRIFEAFDRGEARDRAGLGLGLFITRRIVEAHGGRVDVWSAPGKGTRFEVSLPRGAPSAQEVPS